MSKRHRIPRHKREEILWKTAYKQEARRKQNGRCAYCLGQLKFKTTTADHVIARKNGGTTTRDNIVAACARCNRLKGHMSPTLFKRRLKERQGPEAPFEWQLAHFEYAVMRRALTAVRRIHRAVKLMGEG